MQNTTQHERKSSKTPVKVITPDELSRVCRCSPAILGRGKFNLFSAQSEELKLADRLQNDFGQPGAQDSQLTKFLAIHLPYATKANEVIVCGS